MIWGVEFTIQKYVDKPAVPTVPYQVEPVVPDQQHQPISLPYPDPDVTTRSGCRVRRSFFFEDAHANSSFLHTFSPDKSDESVALLQNDNFFAKPHPFAFAVESAIYIDVSSYPNTMTLSEALQQPDCHEFIKAMKTELRDHIDHKHWKVVPLKSIPVVKHVILMVWSMERKHNLLGDIVKWKDRLCEGGHLSIK